MSVKAVLDRRIGPVTLKGDGCLSHTGRRHPEDRHHDRRVIVRHEKHDPLFYGVLALKAVLAIVLPHISAMRPLSLVMSRKLQVS